MQKAFHSLLVALVAVLALVGCGKSDKGGKEAKPPPSSANGSVPLSGNAPVDIVNFEFKPQKVVVKPGTTVTWTNRDTSIHDIKDTSPLATPRVMRSTRCLGTPSKSNAAGRPVRSRPSSQMLTCWPVIFSPSRMKLRSSWAARALNPMKLMNSSISATAYSSSITS